MSVGVEHRLWMEGVWMAVWVRGGAGQTQVPHQVPSSHTTLQTVLQAHPRTVPALLALLLTSN